jgi:hypothetical protein
MSGNGVRSGGIGGETLPANDGDGRPLSRRQRFEYWETGYRDGRDGLPPLRWMKQSWPEDGRDAYYEGHETGRKADDQ